MPHCNLVHNKNQCKSLSKHAFSIKSKFNKDNGALLYTYKNGYMTLEAAIVLPLVILFMAGVLFFFRFLQIQTGIQEALDYAGRKTAVLCATNEDDFLVTSAANSYFKDELQLKALQKRWICAKNEDLRIEMSDNKGEYVFLTIEYEVKTPFNILGFGKIPVRQTTKCRKWIGNQVSLGPEGEEYVYITKDGDAFHKTLNCSYLDLSITPQSIENIGDLRNLDGNKYRPCVECVVENQQNFICFVTNYGDFYHSSISCSALKRTVYCVRITEVGGRHPCAKCLKN